MKRVTVLSGDIGGTNTRFELHEYKVKDGLVHHSEEETMVVQKTYRNEEYPSFIAVTEAFLATASVVEPPIAACFAVAGPVSGNMVRFTNRGDWTVDGDMIALKLKIQKVLLINDFLAVGYGLLTLDVDKECLVLQKGIRNSSAPMVAIGAGTGLGQVFLTPDSGTGTYQAFPTEGGHAEFAPRDDVEIEMFKYLKDKFGCKDKEKGRISVERIVSGTGLANIYEFLSYAYPEKVNPEIEDAMKNAGDNKGVIIATNTSNELCRKTMEIFVSAYGSEAGVAALKWLPYGGLFLTGGLTPKNIDLITQSDGPFMKALLDKGRVAGMVCSVPIYAVMVENLGQRGAQYMAKKIMHEIDGYQDKEEKIKEKGRSSETEKLLESSLSELKAAKQILLFTAGITFTSFAAMTMMVLLRSK